MRDFLENRTVIASTSKVHPETLPALDSPLLHPSLRVAHTRDQEFPKLELKHDTEGRIKEIVVICHCGERIVLQCNY